MYGMMDAVGIDVQERDDPVPVAFPAIKSEEEICLYFKHCI
jgi:hypothetical protein